MENILQIHQVTKIKIVLKQNGTEIIYQAGIANIFNDFFVSVGPKLASTFNFTGTSHISPHTNQTNFNNKSNPFHSAENHWKIRQHESNGSRDDFGVKGSPILSYYLTHIFNLSLNTGSVPSSWKKKRVINQYLKKETLKMWTTTVRYLFYQ